eukprot:CAMPEP_0194286844 /NCGR_PEP_ID=MMETSP0169-20130528/33411_1 /TAXON_ID=218684 /ORGANISM="Corethron pennatum, Strain L29A3" /LENGTH=386 /DNA_ID=CAMNT_0039033367 /DNA_START=248 /DNA_END=1409 /DNA_ORIENTATION=-
MKTRPTNYITSVSLSRPCLAQGGVLHLRRFLRPEQRIFLLRTVQISEAAQVAERLVHFDVFPHLQHHVRAPGGDGPLPLRRPPPGAVFAGEKRHALVAVPVPRPVPERGAAHGLQVPPEEIFDQVPGVVRAREVLDGLLLVAGGREGVVVEVMFRRPRHPARLDLEDEFHEQGDDGEIPYKIFAVVVALYLSVADALEPEVRALVPTGVPEEDVPEALVFVEPVNFAGPLGLALGEHHVHLYLAGQTVRVRDAFVVEYGTPPKKIGEEGENGVNFHEILSAVEARHVVGVLVFHNEAVLEVVRPRTEDALGDQGGYGACRDQLIPGHEGAAFFTAAGSAAGAAEALNLTQTLLVDGACAIDMRAADLDSIDSIINFVDWTGRMLRY